MIVTDLHIDSPSACLFLGDLCSPLKKTGERLSIYRAVTITTDEVRVWKQYNINMYTNVATIS